MNKLNSTIKTLLTVSVILTTCLYSGCEEFYSEKDFKTITVPLEQTRQIDILELQETKTPPDEPAKSDKTQPPAEVELSLEQCRSMSLNNNLRLKTELIDPAIAAQQVTAEQAKFESAFTARMNHTKTDTPTSTTLSASKYEDLYFNYGISVPLTTGGTVNVNLLDDKSETDNSFATLNPAYTTDFSVSISQPLLRDAGKRVNTHSIRIAEYSQQITDAQTKLEVITVIAAADRVYWRLYAAQKELQVRKQQHELALAQLEKAQRFVDAGQMAQVEIIRAESGVAQQLEAIIVAENNLRDRQRELKRSINKSSLTIDTPTAILCMTEPDPINYILEPESLVDLAIENRTEMLQLELQIAQSISSEDFYRNQTLPLVTLDYTYNVNGLGAARTDAYDLLYDKNFEDHRLGLQLTVPLGNVAAKSALMQAFYTRRKYLASKENQRQLIQLDVLNAIDQVQANWQRILASRQRTILDNRLYQAEQRQFELGLRTSTDVLQAQTDFANAQSAEISALTEYQIALVDLAYATGTLLGAAKVEWEPITPPGEPGT